MWRSLDRRTGVRVLLVVPLLVGMLSAAGCGIVGGGRSSGSYPGEAIPPIATDEADSAEQLAAEDGSDTYKSSGNAVAQDGDAATTPETIDAARLLVRMKSMLLRVDEIDQAVEDVRTLASAHGGSVQSLRIADDQTGPVYREDAAADGRALAGYITVRVPVAEFDAFVTKARKLGRVLRQSEDSTDVTQQHVDLKARLQNLRAEEARLREMFESATKVSDMLDVERELSRVRGEAEAMQAQIDSLEKQAALSTITLELVEPEPIVRPQGVDWGVADAFTEGLRSFVGTLNGLIVLTMGIAPVGILGAVAFFALRPIVRRRRRSREPASATASAHDGPDSL